MPTSAAQLEYRVVQPHTPEAFEQLCIEVFWFQYRHNTVYRTWVEHLLGPQPRIDTWQQIPFLPIEFFKTHPVQAFEGIAQKEFTSSGTTGPQTSRHLVHRVALYDRSWLEGFRLFYGPVEDYCILALLPGYLERSGSSLVHMAQGLVQLSGHPNSGFYLDEHERLAQVLANNEAQGQKTLLLGVSFGLLDWVERYPMPLQHTIVMETGGMKGRRHEITRQELHQTLQQALGLPQIHSEYGMTELLSQAYSCSDQLFDTPPWMRIRIRDAYDPFTFLGGGKTGGINVIDLANLYSCSFIETKDLGRLTPDGRFEVLGRFDNSDIRGCNLLIN